MQCEICGRHIEEGKRLRVEGSVVVACDGCSRYGDVIGEAKYPPTRKRSVEKKIIDKRAGFINVEENLVEGFPQKIQNARENRKMKQEELARKINEPASVVRRIESGKMMPTSSTIRKIEKELGIHLMEKSGEADTSLGYTKESKGGGLTLGDLIVIKRKKK